ncbi:putative leucine-rich repeat-containing protein DDB_G0290503 [Lucilia sericata]|uniref:putative leucine-rich repeat-containing protein DDB_G0290503 n=1 Tax=Lucilia sericata TaxID=13632 RepID=UPI0018A80E4F|nr:putative leucine-rich repeat-containing protein DDB_G0290503 [Lucilia sericata]
MAHPNPNSKFLTKLSAKHKPPPPQPNIDKKQTFFTYCSSKKESTAEMTSSHKNSYEQFKKYNSPNEDYEDFGADGQGQLLSSDNFGKTKRNFKKQEISEKLKDELQKYRNELKEYTNSTKDLQEKYLKINSELNEMKQKHIRLINKRNLPCGDFETYSDSSSSTGTVYSLRRKCTQIFKRSKSFILLNEQPLKQMLYNSHKEDAKITETMEQKVQQILANKENIKPVYDNDLQNVYMALKTVMDDQSKAQQSSTEIFSLKNTITKLQDDSERFCSIIEEQKNTLSDYRSRFAQAQQLVQQQQIEIEKLNSNNQQLEADASIIIDQLRNRIETKLRDVEFLTDVMREEQLKKERAIKENLKLNERLEAMQAEANQLKIKLEEMSRRKMSTITRLKVAERDLKIFKDYNTALKQEKRKLNEKMKIMSGQLESLQNASKRTMNRQREHNEKQRRELQKRIYDLEMKLNRSQNSTSSLIQERDSLIAELQSQLNSLVHNFEVSQKHIRVLRRHIYTMCGSNCRQSIVRNRAMGELI